MLLLCQSCTTKTDDRKQVSVRDPYRLERLSAIGSELLYFRSANRPGGLIVDHINRHRNGETNEGMYHAASKTGFQLAVFLKVCAGEPGFQELVPGLTVQQLRFVGREAIADALAALETIGKSHPRFRGFVPWGKLNRSIFEPTVEKDKDGRAGIKLPAVDQGILAFALVAVRQKLQKSPDKSERELASRADRLVKQMDFSAFFDSKSGKLSGTLWIYPDGEDIDREYFLTDYTESLLPVLFAVLHGHVSEQAFRSIKRKPVTRTVAGQSFTTFPTWRASWHEIGVPLIFLPLKRGQESLYANFLAAHVAHAEEQGLTGFPSTAYGMIDSGEVQYLQMGLPMLSVSQEAESDQHSVFYACCLAVLVDRQLGMHWVHRYSQSHPSGPFGAWESIDSYGRPATIATTDAKAMAILGLSGGVVAEITNYLKSSTAPNKTQNMLDYLNTLMNTRPSRLE